MVLSKENSQKIINFVKKEPCLIQDISNYLNISWVTAERYVEKIEKENGILKTKTFRKGTQGAIKLVYYNYTDSLEANEIQKKLFSVINSQSNKKYFDPLEIFQYVDEKKSKAFVEKYTDVSISLKQKLVPLLRLAKEELFVFSGNLSFLNMIEGKTKIIDLFEELLKKGIIIRIVTRIDFASLENISKLDFLVKKYKNLEIKHSFQPLRGFIIDGDVARLKDEKDKFNFKKNELVESTRVFYEFYDKEWIDWLKNVFWYLYRNSLSYTERKKVLERILP
jgi:hypothetical protein